MEKKIERLSDALINQIKAGEVVERPYNVVKELVENSLDSGALSITVELLDAGKQMIRVTDDGCGIPAEEVPLALERHATSKLKSFSDLEALVSFGFRGEALPSIVAVSRFTIRSRSQKEELGTEFIFDRGSFIEKKSIAMPRGTVIQVKDLFTNVPVRLKFLKSTATEFAYIHDFLFAVAASRPDVSFKFSHNGRDIFQFRSKKNLAERFTEMVGPTTLNEFTPVSFVRGSFELTGYVGLPSAAKNIPSHFITFVNGRYVKDRIIRSGILQAYQGLILKGLVPSALIFVQVPPSWVDVNAHPAKIEIRFRDAPGVQELVALGIQEAVKKAVQQAATPSSSSPSTPHLSPLSEPKSVNSLPERHAGVSLSSLLPKERAQENLLFSQKSLSSSSSFKSPSHGGHTSEAREGTKGTFVSRLRTQPDTFMTAEQSSVKPLPEQPNQEHSLPLPGNNHLQTFRQGPFASANYLGQFANCYLFLEIQREMWIIDQHAFHERILFEEMLLSQEKNSIVKQELITPLIIPSTPSITGIICSRMEIVNSLGFDIEPLQDGRIAIHTFPSFLPLQKIPGIFDDILAHILAQEGVPTGEEHPLVETAGRIAQETKERKNPTGGNIFHTFFATMACHAAVRAGDPLNPELVRRLLNRAGDVDFYAHCPHGRPVIRKFTERDVSSWFQRL